MTSFKEFLLSFLEATKDRLKNPALGTFALAWIAFNWRIVSILLWSNNEIEQRIQQVENSYLNININLWYPLITVGFYMLILPYIMALFDALSKWAILLRKGISRGHKINDIKAKQEIAAEEWQLDIIKQGSPDVSKLKDQIQTLQNQLEQRDELIRRLDLKVKEPTESKTSTKSSNENPPQSEIPKKTIVRKRSNKKTSSKVEQSDNERIFVPSSNYPVMRDVVVRDLAKTESEWILLYGFYAGQYGSKEFTRDDIKVLYEQSNRKTLNRSKNLSHNVKTLIKQGLMKYINDTDILLSDSGKSKAQDILNR